MSNLPPSLDQLSKAQQEKLLDTLPTNFSMLDVVIFLPAMLSNKVDQSSDSNHDHLEAIKNEFDEEAQGTIATQQGHLQNAVTNLEGRVVADSLNHLEKVSNAFDSESDVVSKQQKKDAIEELEIILATFYAVLIPIYAASTTAKRAKEFGGFTNFKYNSEVKAYVEDTAQKASTSHVETIIEDLRLTIQKTYGENVDNYLQAIKDSGRTVTDEDLVLAREKALEGASQQRIITAVKEKYAGDITNVRAKAIARTETNRAFTQAQYQADLQFLIQNDLLGRAYKKWVTRSDNPCPICISLSNRPPIPFKQDFASIGDELTATYTIDGKTKVLKQLVSFEDLGAGNAHVNCSCRYQLIIQ